MPLSSAPAGPSAWNLPHGADSYSGGRGPAAGRPGPLPALGPLPEHTEAAGAQRGLGPTGSHTQMSEESPDQNPWPQGRLMFFETRHYFYPGSGQRNRPRSRPAPQAFAPAGSLHPFLARKPQPLSLEAQAEQAGPATTGRGGGPRGLPDANAGAPASSHGLCSHRAHEETESPERALHQSW